MFGLFFDKMNNKVKTSNENIKDTSPRFNGKLQSYPNTSISTTQTLRVNSTSPTHQTSGLQGSNHSPVNSQPSPQFKYSQDQKKYSPKNLSPKQNEIRSTNISTYSKKIVNSKTIYI